MVMTEEQRKKAINAYRKIKRNNIKSKINELERANNELFKLWCYEKALDDKILRRGARENLIKIEELKVAYDKAATENISDEEIIAFKIRF